jgi:hypothetical protein
LPLPTQRDFAPPGAASVEPAAASSATAAEAVNNGILRI